MSSAPAPQPGRPAWVSEKLFHDVDAQAAQYHGYDQRYQQLSGGPFVGRFKSFTFGDDLVIHFETANREIAASASTPAGRYGACFLAGESPPCALNAIPFSQEHVVLSPENKCVEGKMSEGVGIYCMDVGRALFPDDGAEIRTAGVLRDPSSLPKLRELVQSGIETFTCLGSLTDFPAAVCGFKSALAELLWQMTARRTDEDVAAKRYTTNRTLRVFRRARDFIHHHLADGISIPELCKEAGVSRRSLETVFRSVIDMGPGAYIRVLQLNHIRRDLALQTDSTLSIGVIAAKHGIWHWSRFSGHYRALFGELPSETRLRHQRNS